MLENRLRQLRTIHHLTQSDIAGFLQISRTTYSLYETGKRQMSYALLIRLADYYGVSLDYLFGRTEDPAPPQRLSETEKWVFKRFRSIDDRGKHAILAILHYEHSHAAKQREMAVRNQHRRP